MRKKTLWIVFLIIFSNLLVAQLGSNCGIPQWYNNRDYQANAYVKYNSIIYKSTAWNNAVTPGTNATWLNVGSCNENLIISNPTLAYTNCQAVNSWTNTTPNYSTNDLVNYNYGVYKAKYWVAGNIAPDTSDAYEFLGICVIPVTLTPQYTDGAIVIQPTLTSINLNCTFDNHGFTNTTNKIKIKPAQSSVFQEYDMTVSSNNLSYNWTPASYGDYDLVYKSINSVGVITEVNRTIKIAVSQPPTVNITSPTSGSIFNQLTFSPISCNFNVTPDTGNTITSIQFVDVTANITTTITPLAGNNYSYSWTPSTYGANTIKVIATDNRGTSNAKTTTVTINNPATQNISFSTLPNQLKMIHGVSKTFVFDKPIASILKRDSGLCTHSISGNQISFTSTRTGRTGLEITTTDGNKYYVGLRVDNTDGSVPRYPNYVAVGSVSEDITDDVDFYNNGMNNTNLLKNNRMDVRYIYINGGPLIGWNSWQPDRAKKFAKNSLKMGLIPYFIFYNIPDGGESYTTDLEHVRSADYMNAYFNNVQLFLNDVKSEIGDEFFGVILEPDFLGYMQQNNEPTTSPTSVGASTISNNAGTLRTLVERINKTFNDKRISDNLNMEFGWQLNLWAKPGVAGIRGIIRETDSGDFTTKLNLIKQTARDIFQYGNNMGIMTNSADFISIDKYGLDAMGAPSNSNPADPGSYTWFWNNDHWLNYLAFVNELKTASGKHVILWQIPVGHINGTTTTNEYTSTNFQSLNNTSKHYEDSASTFFFGDTVDFSSDNARFSYFSNNVHNDSKLSINAATKQITFGNHIQEVANNGTRLILMGAGVGDSTDGIGALGTTLTDDHFWIQKLQDYYINHLVNLLGVNDNEIIKEDNLVSAFPNPVTEYLTINSKLDIVSVEIYDLNGKSILRPNLENKTKINCSNLPNGTYIVMFKTKEQKYLFKNVIKN